MVLGLYQITLFQNTNKTVKINFSENFESFLIFGSIYYFNKTPLIYFLLFNFILILYNTIPCYKHDGKHKSQILYCVGNFFFLFTLPENNKILPLRFGYTAVGRKQSCRSSAEFYECLM